MKTFMFQINYHHWYSGRTVEIKLGIVKAANSAEAEKKVWDIYGADNASMPNGIIDISDKETVSYGVYAHDFHIKEG